MASAPTHRRHNSMDEPLNICDSIRRFMVLYDRHYPELQDIILALRGFLNTFEKDFKKYTEVSRAGGMMGIAGGAIAIAGLVLAPFTMGASAAVASAGAVAVGSGMVICGEISSGLTNWFKGSQQKKLVKNFKDRLERFQNKIILMDDILKLISKNIRDINEEMLRIKDEMAVQVFIIVGLTATLKEVFGGIGLVLDILSVIEDNKALDDMDKLARNRQISESEMKSKAGKFIVKMRKVIHQLQDIMDKLQRAKDNITRGLNQIWQNEMM